MASWTSHRGGKITKSATAVPGVELGAERTVNMDGSGWSYEILPTVQKRPRSYL